MNPQFLFNPVTYKPFATVALNAMLAQILQFAPNCLLSAQVNPCGSHEDVSGFIDGRLYTLYTSVFHFCQTQTLIITTELWGNECVCVCFCRESMHVRESSGGAMWYR